jgi:hypothetical protein
MIKTKYKNYRQLVTNLIKDINIEELRFNISLIKSTTGFETNKRRLLFFFRSNKVFSVSIK